MLKSITLVLLLLISSSTVLAQYDNQKKDGGTSFGARDGRFESAAVMAFQTGQEKVYDGGAVLDVDSQMGWGVSLGWNWTQNLNVSYRLVFTEPDYLATFVPEDTDISLDASEHTMSKYSHQLNLTYHFGDGAFTPFVSGGVGLASVDSNVPTGALEDGCWWDPWWGYICITDWKTYSTTELSYNLGLGLRWDINNALFTRMSYGREYIKLDSGNMSFGLGTLELGLMF